MGSRRTFAFAARLKFVAGVCLIVTLVLGVLPTPLINQAVSSSGWIAMRAAMTPDARR